MESPYIAQCIKCDSDMVNIFDYGYSPPNLGGGICGNCGHEVVSACDVLPEISDLVAKWNNENDLDIVMNRKRLLIESSQKRIRRIRND